MKHLYQTRNKKNYFGFIKHATITVAVLILAFTSFSQTTFPTSDPVTQSIKDNSVYQLSFYATLKNDSKVVLNWVIPAEKCTSHFIIQRSTDGIDFSDAAILFTGDNNNIKKYYRYADDISSLDSGLLYYRLKSVGLDGKSEYSKVKVVRIEKKMEEEITINDSNSASDIVATR